MESLEEVALRGRKGLGGLTGVAMGVRVGRVAMARLGMEDSEDTTRLTRGTSLRCCPAMTPMAA